MTAPETPGSLLSLLMRRRGWSAARLAELARGVSASSVRAYMADATTPRPGKALGVAKALGPKDGRALLEAWGFADLAEGFYAESLPAAAPEEGKLPTAPAGGLNTLQYPGAALSTPALEVIRSLINWFQSIEASAGRGPLIP